MKNYYMERKKKSIPLVAKVIGCVTFVIVLLLNTMLFIKEEKTFGGLTLQALKARAEDYYEAEYSGNHGIIYTSINYGESGYVMLKALKTTPIVTSEMSSATGTLTVDGKSVSTGVSSSQNTTYSVTHYKMECGYDFFDYCNKAKQKLILSIVW